MSTTTKSSKSSKASGSKLSTKPKIKLNIPPPKNQPGRKISVVKAPNISSNRPINQPKGRSLPPPQAPQRRQPTPPAARAERLQRLQVPLPPPPPDLQTLVSAQTPQEDVNFWCYNCCVTIHQSFVLRQLFWLLVLVIYSVVGGVIFSSIEGARDKSLRLDKYHLERERYEQYRDKQRMAVLKINDIAQDRTYDQSVYKDGYEIKLELMVDVLEWYERELGLSVGPPSMTNSPWDTWGGIFYACTLFTTIGYGNYAPISLAGRITSMIYTLLGIPILLLVLCNFGTLAFAFFNNLWRCLWRIAHAFRHRKHSHHRHHRLIRRTESESSATIPLVHVVTLEDQRRDVQMWVEEQKRHVHKPKLVVLPLKVALLLVVGWVSLAGFLSTLLHKSFPTYFTAVYFQFISIATIGLGTELPQDATAKKLLGTLGLVLFGMVMVTMCLYVIQAKIAVLYHQLTQLIDNEYRIKQADPAISGMAASANANIGLKKLWQALPAPDRVLYLIMDDHRKHLLEEYWLSKAQMVNKMSQARPPKYDIGIQTGKKTELHLVDKSGYGMKGSGDEEEDDDDDFSVDEYGELRRRKKSEVEVPSRRYIYNVTD